MVGVALKFLFLIGVTYNKGTVQQIPDSGLGSSKGLNLCRPHPISSWDSGISIKRRKNVNINAQKR